jgi:hypothetical protein
MFRFTTLLVLTAALLVGVSLVPSANADQPGGYVAVNNQTDLTVSVSAGGNSCTIGPHSAQSLYVDLDVSGNVCVHAESLDGSKHWEETARACATVYLNP